MRIKLITKAQELAEHKQRGYDFGAAVEMGDFLGRCLKALRAAREYIHATYHWDSCVKKELLAQINSLLDREERIVSMTHAKLSSMTKM